MSRTTSGMAASSAQICRDLGWLPGTILQTVERMPASEVPFARIRINAVGRLQVLIETQGWHGREESNDSETMIDLRCRDWEKAQ